MKIIIDSNIFIADFRMKSPDWKLLLQSSKNSNIELLVPQIVLDEVFNKFKERLLQSETTLKKETLVINKLTDRNVNNVLDKDFVSNELRMYDNFLKNQFVQSKVRILSYSNISHMKIARKAINRKKPFNENEKGYRDCLIWENVKENLPEVGTNAGNPEVVFITNNKNDFLDNNLELHSDLIEELENDNLDVESLKVFIDLKTFNQEINQLFFVQAKSFKKKLENSSFEDFDLVSIISEFLDKEFLNKELTDEVDLPYYYQDPTIKFIDKVRILKYNNVRKLNSNQFIIDLIIDAEVQLDFFVDKYEHYSRDEVFYSVEDSDWNEYVIWAREIMELPFSLTIIVNNKLELESAQVN